MTSLSESKIRKLIREALDNKHPGVSASEPEGPVRVSSVVDPQAAETDVAGHSEFSPQNTKELASAVRDVINSIDDGDVPETFKQIKGAVTKAREENQKPASSARSGTKPITNEKDEDMKDKKQVENVIKNSVMTILNQAHRLRSGRLTEGNVTYFDFPDKANATDAASELRKLNNSGQIDIESCGSSGKRVWVKGTVDSVVIDAAEDFGGALKKTKTNATVKDVSGASFDDIAKKLGFSVSGAKQAVDKALNKLRFVQTKMDPADVEIMVLTAMKDYVTYLHKSGELNDEDVQLMFDNPDIVRTLDGFRDFLHKYVRRAGKEVGERIN